MKFCLHQLYQIKIKGERNRENYRKIEKEMGTYYETALVPEKDDISKRESEKVNEELDAGALFVLQSKGMCIIYEVFI